MLHKLLTIALPFLAPFVVYMIYHWAVRRRQLLDAQGREVGAWEDFPWVWIVTIGAVLAAVALIVTAFVAGGDPFAKYTTPRFEDGKIVPGRVGQ